MDEHIREAFDDVTAPDELRQATLARLGEERARRTARPAVPLGRRMAFAACAMALLAVLGFAGFRGIASVPVAFISIDVNPSMELSVNRWGEVLSATAYNDDGSVILDAVDVRGMSYVDAVDAIVGSDVMRPYLMDASELVLTVASDDSGLEEQIRSGIDGSEACQGYGGACEAADPELMAEAHDHGMSFGKYAAYQELSALDPSVTPEDCAGMSMAEIRGRIRELGGDVSGLGGQGSGQGQGSGSGDGHGSGKSDGSHDGNGQHKGW